MEGKGVQRQRQGLGQEGGWRGVRGWDQTGVSGDACMRRGDRIPGWEGQGQDLGKGKGASASNTPMIWYYW